MNTKSLTKFALAAVVLASTAACSTAQTQQQPVVASNAIGCNQIQDTVREASAFYAPGNAYAHRQIERTFSRQNTTGAVLGTEVYVMATPGTTREYLQRVLSCHATGAGPAASPNDPLRPSTGAVTEVRVRSVGAGFGVAIFGSDIESSKDVVSRANAMTSGGANVDVKQVGSRDQKADEVASNL